MSIKVAESEFAALCSRYNIWCHKWQNIEVVKCPFCGKVHNLFKSTKNPNDKRPDDQQETIVDYEVFIGSAPLWVECKGRHNTTSWPFSDMTTKQRNFLHSWTERGVMSCVFLLIGPGDAPRDRWAFLVPYLRFKETCNRLIEGEIKSLNWKVALQEWSFYQLDWNKGEWAIPKDGWLASFYPNVLDLPPLFQ